MDGIARMQPPLTVGERVTVRLAEPVRDLIGYVTRLAPLTIEDRHGHEHRILPGTVLVARRVGVSLGRDPSRAPRSLLDDLAAGAGLTGEPTVHRISTVLAGRVPPESVFPERGEWREGTRRARVEGEWLTTNVDDPELLVALCWWATRQNARSVQVRAG